MNNRKCDFCSNFDFSFYSWVPDSSGTRILSAKGRSRRFSRKKQFNFCPVCGKPREGMEGKRSVSNEEAVRAFLTGYENFLKSHGEL